MKRYLALAVCFLIALGVSCPLALALDVPAKPDYYVNDYAGLIPAATRTTLESQLTEYERATSNQVVVAIFPSLENEPLEDFSIRLAEKWKVGQKGKNNGVILLIALKERQVRIEVGYGLEGVIPDAVASQIIQNEIVPNFRRGDYSQGVSSAVTALIQAAQGEYRGTGKTHQEAADIELRPEDIKAILVFCLLALSILFILDLVRYRGYCYITHLYDDRYSFWEWWLRFGILLALLSLLFKLLYYSLVFGRGGYYGSRGGFSSGGGSFGGGGASGRW